jgi:hypothetical protein
MTLLYFEGVTHWFSLVIFHQDNLANNTYHHTSSSIHHEHNVLGAIMPTAISWPANNIISSARLHPLRNTSRYHSIWGDHPDLPHRGELHPFSSCRWVNYWHSRLHCLTVCRCRTILDRARRFRTTTWIHLGFDAVCCDEDIGFVHRWGWRIRFRWWDIDLFAVGAVVGVVVTEMEGETKCFDTLLLPPNCRLNSRRE